MARGAPKEYRDRLAQVSLFRGCDRAELDAIAQLGTEVTVEAGKELTTEGGAAQEAFLVMEGTASCTKAGVRVAEFHPGDFFGEMALISRRSRTATVTADAAMRLMVFHVTEFNRMLNETPAIAVKILRTTAERLLDATDAAGH